MEVPALPGCYSRGEKDVREAIEGHVIPDLITPGMHCDTNVEDYNVLLRMLHGVYDPVVPHADPVEMLCPA
nr:hypothetical protein [Methanoculleus sp.]